MTTEEQLLDFRRTVAAMYAQMRTSNLAEHERWEQFCRARDALFCTHPQSALDEEQKIRFSGLTYYPYDPAYRFILPIEPDPQPIVIDMPLEHDGLMQMHRFGKLHFAINGQSLVLSVYWIMGYGGGIFVPFGDLTNKQETYGGGRYLLDTIKHADLGHENDRLVIDFNYAYNPSCAYNPRWFCPLAPRENRLPIALPVGEKIYRR
ncbi:MAG: DUF1684 domain-containing protein [Chloroflexota bacterium]